MCDGVRMHAYMFTCDLCEEVCTCACVYADVGACLCLCVCK